MDVVRDVFMQSFYKLQWCSIRFYNFFFMFFWKRFFESCEPKTIAMHYPKKLQTIPNNSSSSEKISIFNSHCLYYDQRVNNLTFNNIIRCVTWALTINMSLMAANKLHFWHHIGFDWKIVKHIEYNTVGNISSGW